MRRAGEYHEKLIRSLFSLSVSSVSSLQEVEEEEQEVEADATATATTLGKMAPALEKMAMATALLVSRAASPRRRRWGNFFGN
ncbi:unnamed protein product [Linum trigynum]|uniref:Uncharacterized protein n=1 Tax=Linum trigynum TaxID=586398 RepID=A0AAV2F795_9ROSI